MAVMSLETCYLCFLWANVTQPFTLMLHAKVQTSSIGVECNDVIVIAQKKKMFLLSLQGFRPDQEHQKELHKNSSLFTACYRKLRIIREIVRLIHRYLKVIRSHFKSEINLFLRYYKNIDIVCMKLKF